MHPRIQRHQSFFASYRELLAPFVDNISDGGWQTKAKEERREFNRNVRIELKEEFSM